MKNYKHFCWEWDGLEISELDPEFEACLCFDSSEVAHFKEALHTKMLAAFVSKCLPASNSSTDNIDF